MNKLFSYLLLTFSVVLMFSCDKLPSINDLSGVYNGRVDVEYNDADIAKSIPATATLSVPSGDEDKVLVELKIQALDIIPVSEMKVKCNLHKSQDKDEYILNGSTTLDIPGIGQIPFSLTGELDKKELDLSITALTNYLTVEVDFEGRK
ncbi:MAG: calycin-like domain-containing protein [Parabacteroides sp.]|nr:calycin-like domain-containing protein [Parabacteroides sp.]